MAENAVELDTDGIEEKQISVEQVQEDINDKPDIGEVDLGYTDTVKPEVKSEIIKNDVDVKKVDNLEEHSDSVQKRINQLTRKMREAERREKAAIDYAKGLQTKYNKVEKDKTITDESYVKEYETRVDSQTEQVKQKLKSAMESQDYESMMTANQELTSLAVEKEKAKMRKQQLEDNKKEFEEQQKLQTVEQPIQQQEPSAKARDWADTNSWFGQDKVMTNAAFTIHEELVQKGFDPESEDYYTEIDRQLQDNFPGKFAKEKPIQTVASAGRKQQGRRKVTLTRSQVAIAKKLGVPLEEYAKYVKE